MKKIVVFVFGLTVSMLGAQTGFEKAYIITTKGDTIRGEAKVNPKKESEAYEKVIFKDANGVQKNYKPGKTKGYGVQDKHFITLNFEGEPRFYRVLTRGDINLYMLAFESMRMNEATYDIEYFLSKPDNKKLVTVKQSKFKKQIADWMEDNPEFLEGYDDEKEFDSEKAISVITQYNNWKAGNNTQ
jgi:hypothetical protein